MDMLEKAARAYHEFWREESRKLGNMHGLDCEWEELPVACREATVRGMHAVLEAVREPSEEMVAAGERIEGVDDYQAEDVWQAMLDALLGKE